MTVMEVIETRSTESMPFFSSFFAFLNSLVWTYYGTKIAKDKMISIPNQVGLGMTGLQMLVYAILFCGQVTGVVAKPIASKANLGAGVGAGAGAGAGASSPNKHAYSELKSPSD